MQMKLVKCRHINTRNNGRFILLNVTKNYFLMRNMIECHINILPQ